MPEKQSGREPDWNELSGPRRRRIPLFFTACRLGGMAALGLSMVFLFNQNRAPILKREEFVLQNGPLGNVFLMLGAGLFGIYLVYRITRYFLK